MSPFVWSKRRSFTSVAMLLVVACSGSQSHVGMAAPDARLSEPERIAHVLSRLTFGARAGDVERMRAIGIDRWLDQQLQPASIADSLVVFALQPIEPWNQPVESLDSVSKPMVDPASIPMARLMADTAYRAALMQATKNILSSLTLNDRFSAGKIVSAQVSDRQLLEVMSDFWENHFSVYNGKMPSTDAIVRWDRAVLRPRALGKFRDLLGATAHSPAMLYYLDNYLSTGRGLNENYGRELLELHTLGVDGGYTQQDVIDVARALTGWTIDRNVVPPQFRFRPELHDATAKTVLGHTLAAGRGLEDGEEVLDILSRHPSTAHYISLKLARRLVSDDPPAALVDRAAATFRRTDGDIAQVVRTIVTSPEFFSRAAFRAKVKTPFELVVSTRRVLNAPVDTTINAARAVALLGQPTFGYLTPEGWPDKAIAWMNPGTLHKRIKFGGDMASGAVTQLERWPAWSSLASLPLDEQVDGVIASVLAGYAEPATRSAMLSVPAGTPGDPKPGEGIQRLKELLSIAFASPEFQRR